MAPLTPRITSDENHDWSSVGILKGLQLGVHGSACSSPFCMRASTGVLNPGSIQLSLTWLLDRPCWVTRIVCKREAEKRTNEEEIGQNEGKRELFECICMCEGDTEKPKEHLKCSAPLKETYEVKLKPKCQPKLKLGFLSISHLFILSMTIILYFYTFVYGNCLCLGNLKELK